MTKALAGMQSKWAQVPPSLFRCAGIAFLIAMPIFFVTFNVRIAFNSPWVYTTGFDRNNISQRTGVPDAELNRVAEEFRAYFNNDAEFLDVQIYGQDIFNTREIIHMKDVKALVRWMYIVTYIAGGVLVGYMAWGFARSGRQFLVPVLRRTRTGGVFTIASLAAAGIIVGSAFDFFFTLFHEISFRNDFWMLDPRRDFLVVMFPEQFWFESTLLIAFATVAQALLVAGGSWLVLRRLQSPQAD
jgi:integral membrane protein (TIGR01906 family)